MEWKQFLAACLFICLFIISGASCQGVNQNTNKNDDPAANNNDDEQTLDYSVELVFSGPEYSSYYYVYTAWIEDSEGKNLQNLYICDTILGTGEDGKTLTGTALPYWKTTKYSKDNPEDYPTVDGVTGPSLQPDITITRNLKIGEETEFRICFEIDRSKNKNEYFTDRPAFIYKSDLITLSSLDESYPLTLVAYMPNDTLGVYDSETNKYTQLPIYGADSIVGFEAYAYLTSLTYIEDSGGGYNDLVTNLTAKIIED